MNGKLAARGGFETANRAVAAHRGDDARHLRAALPPGQREAERMIHVLNAPSPAATASLPIGRAIADEARKNFGLN